MTAVMATAPATSAHFGDTAPEPASNEGCRVEARSGGNVEFPGDGHGGLGWEEFPSCSYVATVAGGYRATGRWKIELVRGEAHLTVDSDADAPPCAAGVIQAGDTVRAILRKAVNSPDDWFVAVGSDQTC